MSKVFAKIKLIADNGSTDEFLCAGLPDCEEQIADTDGYLNFIEDNPDAEYIDVSVEHYSCGDGESEKVDDDELAEYEKKGEDFLNSDDVTAIGQCDFIILTDNEDKDFSMEGLL